MVTLRALLDRIRWDREFGRGEFTIGYHDRIERWVVSVPFTRVHLCAKCIARGLCGTIAGGLERDQMRAGASR